VARQVCTAPLNLWTDCFSFVTSLFIKNSVASEAPLPKGYLVALARYSVTRSTLVSYTIIWTDFTVFPAFFQTHSPYLQIKRGTTEAKDNNHSVGAGMQQALEYAEIFDVPFT
jgi:hypothetical protein